MIIIKDLNLSFGTQTLFKDLRCTLRPGQKIGLVGPNGAGKSTLLKIIANQHTYDSGSIIVSGGLRIAYLPQDLVFTSESTVLDHACSTLAHEDGPELARARAALSRLLQELGFSKEQLEQPVSRLSTGWKMRLMLGQLLFQEADIYLFDEPTNHLDLVSQERFLRFLQETSAGFVLVSHERSFLEKCCTHILALEQGQGTMYEGSYSSYLEQREAHYQRQLRAYEDQQLEITRKKATIQRFRASATKAAMAQSMMRALDRITLIDPPPAPQRIVTISFGHIKPSSQQVVRANSVAQAYGSRTIFKNLSFTLHRGQKVALVAANGVGKTTLIKTLTNQLQPNSGSIAWGAGVTIGLFNQDQQNSLDPKMSIWDTVFSDSTATDTQTRAVLGALLFPQDTVFKTIKVLSGGERNRVGIAKVLLSSANTLILDEPTNHLDMASKDALLAALRAFPGTILFVSHDRYFVNELATSVLELTPTGCALYPGNYDSFLEQKAEHPAHQTASATSTTKTSAPSTPLHASGTKKAPTSGEIRRLEHAITQHESKLKRTEADLEKQVYGTPEFQRTCAALQKIQNELTALMTAWEGAMEEA